MKPLPDTPVPVGPPPETLRLLAGYFRYSAIELLAALLLLIYGHPLCGDSALWEFD